MYEPDNIVNSVQPKQIVLQNVLIGNWKFCPNKSANLKDISVSTLSFKAKSLTQRDTASGVTFPRTCIIKIIPVNCFVLQLVSAVLAQISTLPSPSPGIGYFCEMHTCLLCLLFANAKEMHLCDKFNFSNVHSYPTIIQF